MAGKVKNFPGGPFFIPLATDGTDLYGITCDEEGHLQIDVISIAGLGDVATETTLAALLARHGAIGGGDAGTVLAYLVALQTRIGATTSPAAGTLAKLLTDTLTKLTALTGALLSEDTDELVVKLGSEGIAAGWVVAADGAGDSEWIERDHGDLAGLADDDHPQYVKDTEFGAKGDVLVGTGAGTFTKLAVGSDDEVLTADSGEASGLKWAAGGGRGLILLGTLSRIARFDESSGLAQTATVSSVASDVITLTGNDASKFFHDQMEGSCYWRIKNTTRSEFAWVSEYVAANQLRVTDADDISAWALNDVISTDTGYGAWAEVDVTPAVGADAVGVYLLLRGAVSAGAGSVRARVGPNLGAQLHLDTATHWHSLTGPIAVQSGQIMEIHYGGTDPDMLVDIMGYFVQVD